MKYDYYTRLKKSAQGKTGTSPPVEEVAKVKSTVQDELDRSRNKYLAAAANRIIEPGCVGKYNNNAEMAKKLARSQRWDLELEQTDAEGRIAFTLPLAFLRLPADLAVLAALIRSTDEFFIASNENNDITIKLTYRLYHEEA